jgi:hypothetical protein
MSTRATVRISARRGAYISRVSIAQVLQRYLGVPMSHAKEWAAQLLDGQPLVVEMADEYAAYDLANLLEDLGMVVEVEEGHG